MAAAKAERAIENDNASLAKDFEAFIQKNRLGKLDIQIEAARSKEWRAELFKITIGYATQAHYERTSSNRDTVTKRLNRIAHFAAGLAEALEASIDSHARLLIRGAIERRLELRDWREHLSTDYAGLTDEERREINQAAPDELPGPLPAMPLESLLPHVRDLVQASVAAEAAMGDDEAEIREGDAWERWLESLLAFCKRNGLLPKASSKSAFTGLVDALQFVLADELAWLLRRKLALQASSRITKTMVRWELESPGAIKHLPDRDWSRVKEAMARARDKEVADIKHQFEAEFAEGLKSIAALKRSAASRESLERSIRRAKPYRSQPFTQYRRT